MDERFPAPAVPPLSVRAGAPPARSLVRDTVLLVCARGATLLFSFVALTLLLPRCMRDPRDVGLFRQVSLWFTLAVPVVGFSLSDSLSYFVPRCGTPAGVRGLVTRTLLVLFGLGLLLAAAAFLAPDAAAVIVGRSDAASDLSVLLRTAAPLACALLVMQALEATAVARNRVRGYTAYLVIVSAVGFAWVVSALVWSPTPRAVVQANVAGMSVAAVAGLVFAWRCGWIGGDASAVPLREQMRYAWPLWMMGLVGVFGENAAQWTISVYLAPADLAVFSYGKSELPPLLILSSAMLAALTPRLAGSEAAGRRDETVRLWHTAIRHLALCFVPALICFGLMADSFIGLMLPPPYRDAAGVFRVYLGVTAVRMFAFHAIYQGTGHTRAFFRATMLYLALNVPLCLLLVRWGGLGPAVANLVSTLATNALHVVVVGRCLGLPPARVLPWKTLVKVLAVGAAAAVPVVLVGMAVGDRWVQEAKPLLEQVLGRRWMYGVHALRLIAGGAGYAVAYVPLAWAAGLLTPEERDRLRGWLGRTRRGTRTL